MKQRADNRIAGFSLIEVIVGIAVLGLVTVPLCASLVLSVRINAHSRDLMNAQLAAASAVETLMESGIKTGTGSDFPVEEDGEWTMSENALPLSVDSITVSKNEGEPWYTVTVVGGSNGQTVELTTSIREADMNAVEGGGT